jgi:hypothetical protein
MTPKEIIARAWAITKKERALRRWGYIASFFETTRTLELLLYQAYYLYWYAKGVTVGWVSVEAMFFRALPLWLFVTITASLLILFILQLFVPTLATGSLIGLAAKSYRKEEVRGGLVLALYNFFPILEIHGLFVLSDLAAIVTAFSILVRYGGTGSFKYIAMAILAFLGLVSIVFHFLASFSEESVVIRKEGAFAAIGRSFKLILSHVSHVVFLGILLIVISIRVFINAVMIFLFPGVLTGIALILALFLPTVVTAVITSIVGVILLGILTYFFAYLHVFKQTVWTITYLELSRQKDLDVIDGC